MKQLKSLFVIILSLFFYLTSNAQPSSNQPTFVLVHGAWHGGWCWSTVSAQLSQKGYRVFTPTLTGLGERKHLSNEKVNLETHIQDIINMIEMENLTNIYLVGHSYAGAIIAAVADRIPQRLAKLIFLDAMIVENGQSVISLQPETIRKIQLENIKLKEDFEPFDVALFGITDSVISKDIKGKLTPQPFNTFAQTLTLNHPYGNGLPLIYIACTAPQLPIMLKMSKKVKNSKLNSWKHFELKTGHDAMITDPFALTQLLTDVIK